MNKWVFIVSVILLLTGCIKKQILIEKQITFDDYFNEIDGSFIMLNEKTDEYIIYNKDLTEAQVSPCSTFKIVNSLIGLEAGVIQDANHMYEWDGTEYLIESWNTDHTLASAINNSVVWYYRRLAKEVGWKQMQHYMDKLNYGNCDISGGITKFWLMSSLKVSPREQVNLLRDLYQDKLPFTSQNMAIVRDILALDETEDYTLSGKTGSGETGSGKTGTMEQSIGWFVGTVERDGNRHYFATFIQGKKEATGYKAKDITLEILRDFDYLDR